MACIDIDSLAQYERDAKHGRADALYNLGLAYSTGQGVAQDIVAAHKWFNLAAVRGSGSRQELAQPDGRRNECRPDRRRRRSWPANGSTSSNKSVRLRLGGRARQARSSTTCRRRAPAHRDRSRSAAARPCPPAGPIDLGILQHPLHIIAGLAERDLLDPVYRDRCRCADRHCAASHASHCWVAGIVGGDRQHQRAAKAVQMAGDIRSCPAAIL